jgi:hypothetical protein
VDILLEVKCGSLTKRKPLIFKYSSILTLL